MKVPSSPSSPSAAHPSLEPQPTADGFDTLYSLAYGQAFHSRHGARAEAEHVFLQGADVGGRLGRGERTSVLGVGFGTGLNFLPTARRALETGAQLRYVALERDLLPADVLAGLNHGRRLGTPDVRNGLLAWRRALPDVAPPGAYRTSIGEIVELEIVVSDATGIALPDVRFDAVYLDAFSPDVNPELWTSSFFKRLFDVLKGGGRLATYSAKGQVRRDLEGVGFAAKKRPGPPGKREMLVAVKPG